MTMIEKWRFYVRIIRPMEYPIEDDEAKGDFLKWADSPEGRRFIQSDFIKRLNTYSHPKNADMYIEDLEIKEYEVKSTDTDPRV